MKGMYLGRRFYRQMFGLMLVMILAPEGLAAQDAIATALDRIHREYSSGPMGYRTTRASRSRAERVNSPPVLY